MAEVLNKILKNLQATGLLQGLGDFNSVGQVLNLQFADDTLLFLHADRKMIVTLRLLLCFENLSGLKVNFNKSEMVSLNISD